MAKSKSVSVTETYFKKHITYSALAFLLTGLGIGIFITYPIIGEHPMRWAGGILAFSLLLHLYPLMDRK